MAMLRRFCTPFRRTITNNFNSKRNISSLIIGEHSNGNLSDSTKACISAASQLNNDEISILISGSNCENVANDASKLNNISRIIYCDNDNYSSYGLTENIASLIVNVINKYSYTHVFGGVSSFTKDVVPRCAGIMDISQLSDITQIIDENTFQRSIYAGNALCVVKSSENIKLLTVRPTSFDINIELNASGNADIIKYDPSDIDICNTKQFIGDEIVSSSGPSLTSASAVVSGGRGLKNGDNFDLLRNLCSLIPDCALGASRAAVDAGYVSNDLQVGQTGKVVAPNMYLAVAISGQIQHIAGMKDSKLIFAVNNDPEAPIFSIADYGLVADLFEAIPQLTELLTKEAKQ